MADELQKLSDHILAKRSGFGISAKIAYGELTLTAAPDTIIGLLTFLRDDQVCKFSQMIDICGVDYPNREKRFDVVYHLLSLHRNHRVRIKIETGENQPVPSATAVWPAANWFEREAFDMYGIQFTGHPDLRRLLTDYGFVGHPLRKDFPLTGFVEVRYDEEQKRVVNEPVKLTQDFRKFDFMSPWEGAKHILPGDEKATKS